MGSKLEEWVKRVEQTKPAQAAPTANYGKAAGFVERAEQAVQQTVQQRQNDYARNVMASHERMADSMYGSANRTGSNLMDMATRAKLMQTAAEMADTKARQEQALEIPRASTAYARQTDKQPLQARAQKVAEIRKDINTLPAEQSRVGKGVQSVMLSPYASIEYLGESGKQAIKNQNAYEESDLDTKLAEAYTYLMQTERAFGYGSPEYEAAQANYDAVQRELQAFKNAPDKAVDMTSRAAQFMGGVQKLQEEALEGTSGAGRFLGETALSIGSNLSKLPLNVIVPGASLALMGAEAAAGKAYELGQQGVNAGQALTRGLVSGGIEALTEKVPLDNLMDIIKTGGKVGLMNILKQAVTEAGEEGVAYLLNFGADKVAGDPEAAFVWNDFWKSVGMGALSGGIMGGGATAINRANTAAVGKTYQEVAPELVAEGLQMNQDTDAYRTATEMQRKLDAGKTLSNVDVGRVVQDNASAVDTLRQAAMEMAEAQVEREVQAAMPKRTAVQPLATAPRTAYTEIRQNTEGGVNGGEEVHLRESGQRNDRAYPGGEVSRMEESAGRDQIGQDSRLPAKDARAADLRLGEEVSTASLGIGNGASNDRIRVVTGGDTEATTKARAIAKERGLRLTLFTGGNLTINGEECRAYITGDRAFVRADHSDFDADQLMRHEAGHDQIAKGEIDIKAATENIRKRLGGRNNVQRVAQTYASAFAGADMTVEEAIEEIICDSLGDMNVFSDTAAETAFGEVLESAKAAAGESRVESKTGPPVEGKESREAKQITDEGLLGYNEKAALAKSLNHFGVEIDSGSVGKASRESWNRTDKQKLASELKAAGFEKTKVEKWINDVNSISALIAGDPNRLDYDSAPGLSSFVSNAEYGGSFDFSTLCKKRRLLTGTFTAIQKALPDTALTADEILEIRRMMAEADLEVSCGLCYVEGSRANMGQFTQEFIRLYKKYNPGKWAPNMAEMNTPDGIEWVRINHPEVYKEYEYFWNHYGKLRNEDKNLFASQQKPKLYQMRTEYKGEILEHFKRDGNVTEKNRKGGLRLQSFSDFETPHLIDTMQIIMDMADVGLAGQAYTKVPNFAWAFGDTGLKINLSLIAKDVDADGKLVFDEKEGMPIADAMALRDRYSANVGTIIVVFTDDQLKAAMADERIDFIIPFHRSQWKKSQYAAMGLPAKTKDYTYQQNEKLIKPTYHEYRGKMVKDKATNYMPNDYWDFSKSGKENAEDYLKMCAENNKRPKFYKLLVNNGDGSYSLQPDGSTDGYWKLLIDFKMYDNDGNGSPQMPVTPEFNMEEAKRIMEEYEGGHAQFPVAQGIVDEFLKKRGKASRETSREDVLKAVEKLLEEADAKLAEQELADQMYYGRKAEVQKRNAQEKLERLREQKNERIAQVRAEGREAVKVARIEERAKRNAKLAEQKQRSKDMLDELRSQKNERIAQVQADLKQQAADRQAKMSERGKAAKMRSKIIRHANKMQQMLLHPSDKRHVPEHLRKATASVLSAINMESGYELSFGTDAKYHRVAPGTDPYAEKTAKTKAFEALRDAYNAIVQNKEEDSIIIDPELLGDSANGVKGLFDQFVELGKKPIADMNSAELEVVWKVLRSVEHSIINAGKMLSKSKYETTKAFADAFASDAAMRRDMNRIFGNKLALDFEDPYTFFSHYGESGKAIYRILRNAQDEVSVKVDVIAQKMQEIVDTETVEAIQKERHEFTTEAGDKLTLTTGQLMSIYNLMHRQQAHDHLMKGGIVQPEIARNGKQPRIDRGTEMIPLSADDLQDLAKLLTDEQKKIASELQKMMTGELANWGNEASMAVYGYEKFTGEDYWPIKSAGEGLNTTIEKNSGAARSIKNIGMAKNTVPHANNALEIGDVFDVFAQHTADMVDYSSWLLPMEDLTRLYNWKYKDENGNKTGKTIKGIMEQKGGKGSQKYLEELLKDIQNGIAHQMDTQTELWINRLIGNAKGASVGANIRVVVQQPTSFLRAAAIFDADSLAKGIAKGVTDGDGWEKAKKYAPIAHIKDVGGFDQGNARTISQQLYGTATRLEAMNEKLSWAAAKADAITWGKLWNAAEWETKKRFPKLEAGSDAFYEKAKELFTDMVDQSQVVDGVLQRTQIMRSGNAINKQASSFMGEPMKTMNMMVRAWDNWRHTEGAERTRYKKQMGRTVIALGVTAATNALMQALVDAIRDDDKEKDYLERVWTAFSGLEGDEVSFKEKTKNVLLRGNLSDNINPIGMYPYASDVLSVMQGYDVTRADADVIADVVNNATALFKSASGEGKRTTIYNAKKLVSAIGKMFGVSAVNLGRDIWSVASTIVRSVEDYRMMYLMDRLLYSVDQNKKQFVKILYDAEAAGETEQAKFIRNSLLKNGVTEEKITELMKDFRRDKEDKIRQEESFVSAKTEASADIMKDVQKSKLYQKASGPDQSKAKRFADAIADYRTMMEQSGEMLYTPSADVAKAENAESVGVSDAQYILYRLALEMADANGNGKITQEEFLNADFELTEKQLAFMWVEDRGWKATTNPYD